LDEGTEHWGVKVERVEVKDIRLPQQLTRAMAAEAEAAREARAKVVAAEGEQKVCTNRTPTTCYSFRHHEH
jgi:erythrocyte band 7 integral membrane protein